MSDVLKKYSIVIGADTRELMTELSKVEKELTDKLSNKDLGAGVRASIDKLIQEVKTMQSELRTATRDINNSITAINTDSLKKEFSGLQQIISGDIQGLQTKIEGLQGSIDILNNTDFSKLETGIGKTLNGVQEKMDKIMEEFKTFHDFTQDLRVGSIDTSNINKAIKENESTLKTSTKKQKDYMSNLIESYTYMSNAITNALSGEKDVKLSQYVEWLGVLRNISREYDKMDSISIQQIFGDTLNIDIIRKQMKDVDDIVNDGFEKTRKKLSGRSADIYLRWKTELDPESTVEKLNKKIDNYQKGVQNHIDKNPLNIKTNIDKKDFENVIRASIKEQNELLKTLEAPKIEVGIKLSDVDQEELDKVSKNVATNIDGGNLSGSFNVNGGSIDIDSSKMAQESTLSEIRDTLRSWQSSGIPGTQTKAEIHEDNKIKSEIKSANALVRGYKFTGAGKQQIEVAKLRRSLLNEHEYAYARKLALTQVTRKGKNLNENSIKNTKLWNDTVEVDGIKYAKWDTQNRTIEDFQKFLLEKVRQNEIDFFKEEKKRIEKHLKVSTENLGLIGVTFDKEGKIEQRSSTAIGKNEIYDATRNKVNQVRHKILDGFTDESGNYHEGLDTEYKTLQLMQQRRKLIQEIVMLDSKNSKTPLDENEQKVLEEKKEQLRLITQICDDEELYNKLLKERETIEEKMSKGNAKFEDVERIEEISTQINSMWHDVSDDFVKYSHDNVKIIDDAIEKQSEKVDKLKQKFYSEVGKIYQYERGVREDKGTDKNGEPIIKNSILDIRNDKDYERALKELDSYKTELSLLSSSITRDKNGKEDLSSLTKSEQERYWALKKNTYELRHQIELYAQLNDVKPEINLGDTTSKNAVQKTITDVYKKYGYDKENDRLRTESEILGLMTPEELQQYSSDLESAMQKASDEVKVTSESIIKDFIDQRIKYLNKNLNAVTKEIAEKKEISEKTGKPIDTSYLTSKAEQIRTDIATLENAKGQQSVQEEILSNIKTENKLDDETISKVKKILDLTVQIEESKKRANAIDAKADIKIGRRDQKKYDELTAQLDNDDKYNANRTNQARLRLNYLNNKILELEVEKTSKKTSKSRVSEIENEIQNAKSEIENISSIYGEYLSIEDQISDIIKRYSTKTRNSAGKQNAIAWTEANQEVKDLSLKRQQIFDTLPYTRLDGDIANQLKSAFGSLDDITSEVIKKYIDSRLSSMEFEKTLSSIISSKQTQDSDKELAQNIKSRVDAEIERRNKLREESENKQQEQDKRRLEEEKKLQRSASTKNREVNQKYNSRIKALEGSIDKQQSVVDEAAKNLEAAKNAQEKANSNLEKYEKFNDFQSQIMYYETLRDSKAQTLNSAQNAITETKNIIDNLTKTLQDKSFTNGQTEESVKTALDNAKAELKKQESDLIALETKTKAEIELYNKEIEKLITKRGASKAKKPYTGIDFSKIYNQSDLKAFEAYNEERMNGTSLNEITAFYRTMSDASERAQEFVRNLNGELVDLNQVFNVNDIDQKQLIDNAIEFVKRGGDFYQLPQEITAIISSYIKSVQTQTSDAVQKAQNIYNDANIELQQTKTQLDDLNKSKEAEKEAIRLYEEQKKYIESLEEQFKIANTAKSKRAEESDLFSYNSRNSVTKGMTDEQKYASFKVDYQLNEVTKLLAEQEKLKSTVGETSDEYKQNAEKIQQAKQYLTEFRNEAVELGLTISQTTGRAILDLSKDATSLGKNMFTGINETYARTKKQLKEIRDENARLAKEKEDAETKEKELQDRITNARLGTAKAEGTEVSTKKESSKANKYTVNMTEQELELRKKLSEEQYKYYKLKNSKAPQEELDAQTEIVEKIKEQVEQAERLELVKYKGKYYANLKKEYLPDELQSSRNSSVSSPNYSSTVPATEGTLSQIRDILVNKLGNVKNSSDGNSNGDGNFKRNTGKFNQEEYIKIAKELGFKTDVSKRTGNEYVVRKSDKQKVYAEMEKRGITRFLEKENKALDDNTKKNKDNTKEKEKNNAERKKSRTTLTDEQREARKNYDEKLYKEIVASHKDDGWLKKNGTIQSKYRDNIYLEMEEKKKGSSGRTSQELDEIRQKIQGITKAKNEDVKASKEQEITDEQVSQALENLINQVTLLEERLGKLDKKSAEYKEVNDALQKAKSGIEMLKNSNDSSDVDETKKDTDETKKNTKATEENTKAKKENKNAKGKSSTKNQTDILSEGNEISELDALIERCNAINHLVDEIKQKNRGIPKSHLVISENDFEMINLMNSSLEEFGYKLSKVYDEYLKKNVFVIDPVSDDAITDVELLNKELKKTRENFSKAQFGEITDYTRQYTDGLRQKIANQNPILSQLTPQQTLDKYGKATLQKFIDGAIAETPEIQKAFEEIAQIPEKVVRDALQIHSPSKVMEKLGLWTGEGFAEGVMKSSDAVKQRIQEMLLSSQVTEEEIKSLIGWDGKFDDGKSMFKRNTKIGKQYWTTLQNVLSDTDLFNYQKQSSSDIDTDKLFKKYVAALKKKNTADIAINNISANNVNYQARLNAEQEIANIEEQINQLKKQGIKLTKEQENEILKLKSDYKKNLDTTLLSRLDVGYNNLKNSGIDDPNFVGVVDNLSEKLKKLHKYTDNDILSSEESKNAKDLSVEISKIIKELSIIKNNPDMKITEFGNLSDASNIAKILSNTRGIRKESVNIAKATKLVSGTIKEANGSSKILEYTWNDILGKFVQSTKVLTSQLTAWDRLKGTVSKSVSYFKSYFSGYMVAQRAISTIKTGIQYVKQFDTALTELRLVSRKSEESIGNLATKIQKVAQNVGSTSTEITKSVTEWARLGKTAEDSLTLASQTAKLAKVGFMEVGDATTYMTSSLQAFYGKDLQNKTKDVETAAQEISDKFVQIGNNFAITSADIGSGLTRSAAALVAANNDIDESIALTTAGNTVLQDADSVSNALKVVSMRLRGTAAKELEKEGEETDGLIENASKLYKTILDLTSVNGGEGVKIIDDDGNYKSTYAILKEISEVWNKIDDKSQAALLETMAGKTRGAAVAAILQNGDILEDAYNSSKESEGATDKGMKVAMDSIESRGAQFKQTWESIWQNLISSDFIKNITSFIGELSKLIKLITDFKAIIPTLGSVFAIMAFKKRSVEVKSYAKEIKNLNKEEAVQKLRNEGLHKSDIKRTLAKNGLSKAEIKEALSRKKDTEATKENSSEKKKHSNVVRIDRKEISDHTTAQEQDTSATINDSTVTQNNEKKGIFGRIKNLASKSQTLGSITASGIGMAASTIGSIGASLTDGKNSTANRVFSSISTIGTMTGAGAMFGPVGAVIGAGTGIIKSIFDAKQSLEEEAEEKAQKIAEAYSNAKEKVKEFTNSIKSMSNYVSDNSNEISRYAELLQGVNVNNNTNLYLSNEEYKEFLDISNNLADLFPRLVKGYDDNGNAILKLGGNVGNVTSSLNDMIETEKEIARLENISQAADLFAGANQEYSDAKKKLDDVSSPIKNAHVNLIDTNGIFESDGFDVILDALTDYDIDAEYHEYEENGKYFTKIDNWEVVKSEFFKKLETFGSGTIAETELITKEIEDKKNDLVEAAQYFVLDDEYYKNAGEKAQDAINNLIAGVDFTKIPNDLSPAVQKSAALQLIYENVIDPIKSIDDEKLRNEIFDSINLSPDDEMFEGSIQAYLSFMNELENKLISKGIEIPISTVYEDKTKLVDDVQNSINNMSRYDKNTGFSYNARDYMYINLVTEEDYSNWLKYTEGCNTAKEAIEAYKKGLEGANQELEKFRDTYSTVEQIDGQVKGGLNSLGSVYSKIFKMDEFGNKTFNTKTINIDDLSGIKSAVDSFNELNGVTKITTEEYNEFVNTLTDPNSTPESVQDAFDNFATLLINNSNAVEVDSDSINTLKQTLHQLGIVNSDEIFNKIADSQNELAEAGVDVNKITIAEATNMLKLGEITDDTKSYMASYILTKHSDSALTTTEDVASLYNFCSALAETSEEIENLLRLRDLMAYYDQVKDHVQDQSALNSLRKHIIAAREEAEKEVENIKKKYQLKITGIIDFDPNAIKNENDELEKTSGQVFDWIQRKIEIAKNAAEKAIKSIRDTLTVALTNFRVKNAFKQLNNEFKVNAKAYAAYMKEANKFNPGKTWINKIQSGAYTINEIENSGLANKINKYKEYYEKAQACAEANYNLRDSIDSVAESLAKAPINRASELVDKYSKRTDLINNRINAVSGGAKESYYNSLNNFLPKNMTAYSNAVSQEQSNVTNYGKTITSFNYKKNKAKGKNEATYKKYITSLKTYISGKKKIPEGTMDVVFNYGVNIGNMSLYESCVAYNKSFDSLYDAQTTAEAYAVTMSNERKANNEAARDALISSAQNATSAATSSYNYTYASINSGLYSNNRQDTIANYAYAKATKKQLNQLDKTVSGSRANTLTSQITAQRKKANAEYKKALLTAQSCINNKKQIPTDVLAIINKYDSTTYMNCLGYNTDYNNWVLASYEEAVNYATTSANFYDNKHSMLENNLSEQDRQDQALDAKIKTRENAREKNALIDSKLVNVKDRLYNYSKYTSESIDLFNTYRANVSKYNKSSIKTVNASETQWNAYKDAVNSALSSVSSGNDISESIMAKLLQGVEAGVITSGFYMACVDYNNSLQYKLQLEYEKKVYDETSKVDISALVGEKLDNLSNERHHDNQRKSESLNGLKNLVDDEMLFDSKHNATKYFSLQLGTSISLLVNAQNEMEDYLQDIEDVKNAEADLTPDDYLARLEEAQNNYLGAAATVKQYKDALVDLYKNAQNEELAKINELIDAREKALQNKKSYYDYDRSIKDKNKNILALQNEIAALDGLTDAENKAQKARLEAQLSEAQQDMDETVKEHTYNLQVDGLNDLKDELAKLYDENIKNFKTSLEAQEKLIAEQKGLVKSCGAIIESALNSISNAYGINIDTSGINEAYNGFATGGIVTKQGVREDGLVALSAGETVLTDRFTSILPNTVKIMETFNNSLTKNIPTNKFAPSSTIQPINLNINYDSLINVNGSVDATVVSDMKKLTNDIVNKTISTISKDMRRSGVQFKM